MSLLDKMKRAFFEEEIKPPTPKALPEETKTVVVKPMIQETTAEKVSMDVSNQNESYIQLKSKIDFNKTTACEVLQKYMAPMEGAAIPEQTKYQLVLAQIKAIEGIDSNKLLATFDGLKSNLTHEVEVFNEGVQIVFDKKVAPLVAKINEVNKRIADLTSEIQDQSNQLTTLTSQKIESENKIAKAQAQFALAAQLISNEIEADQARYSNLLKG